MSLSGSPETATRSAYFPFSIERRGHAIENHPLEFANLRTVHKRMAVGATAEGDFHTAGQGHAERLVSESGETVLAAGNDAVVLDHIGHRVAEAGGHVIDALLHHHGDLGFVKALAVLA